MPAGSSQSDPVSEWLPERHTWEGPPTAELLAPLPTGPAVFLFVDTDQRPVQLLTTQQFRRIAQTTDAVAVAIVAPGVNDRVMVQVTKDPQRVTLTGGGESFTFTGSAFVRIDKDEVEVVGDLTALTVKVSGHPKLLMGGVYQPCVVSGGMLTYPE